jgi:putative membrane protein
VLVLAAAHGFMARWTRDFANDRNTRPARFYRIVNEVPAVIMLVVVILVVVKPF